MPEARHSIRPSLGTRDQKLLEEIRENYDTDNDAFQPIRDQGGEDIKFIANDPWPDKEKQARKEASRPMVSCDLLNQYCNQVINEVRRHPREIKISPAGYGATAKLAEYRENRIRAIQYKSDAQAAYITAIENGVQRSYGFARIGLRYVSEKSFDQEIYIARLPNPDAVLFDAASKELDSSDADHCFVLDHLSRSEFRRRWPDAEIIDFSGEMARDYAAWIKDKFLQVAEYWRVKKTKDTLVLYDDGTGSMTTGLLSELGGELSDSVLKLPAKDGALRIKRKFYDTRDTDLRKLTQYITNGVEILEENKWLGKWIPIVPLWGKEFYITEAGGSRRMLASLIRNARDAQMSYNYFKTCQTEAAGMVPKTTYMAMEGQLEGHEEEYAQANKTPTPFLYYKGSIAEIQNGEGLPAPLPAPRREPFDPPIQGLEIGAESFARAVQTAVGMYNTSVGQHDTNVKSGKAIEELDSQSDQGAFHFIDNYNRFITACGRIVNDLLTRIEVSQREVPIRKADGTESIVHINTAEPYPDEQGRQHHYPIADDDGQYSETVSVAPTFDSQRDEATDFLKTFLSEVIPIINDPGQRNRLIALSIKLRQLGPIGDQMADILVPPPGDPAQTAQQLQATQAELQQLQQENAALHADRAGRVLEQQTKMALEQMKQRGAINQKQWDYITKVVVAELAKGSKEDAITAQLNADRELAELGFHHDQIDRSHDAAHEVALEGVKSQNAQDLASQNAVIAAAQQQPEAQPTQ